MSVETILREMRAKADLKAVEGMARFGISSKNTLGLSIPTLRGIAKRLGTNHSLAHALWKSGIHEARILAAMVDDPAKVTEKQMDDWVEEFDSWDVCDQCYGSLFDKTSYAYDKAVEWSGRKEEFVKRAGYVLMAELAVHDKEAEDKKFLGFFDAIEKGSKYSRNFVKKAVNWAVRQIGKRNLRLNKEAQKLAIEISRLDGSSAKWVASDALRDLRSRAVQARLRRSS
ncbi:MAG: DNA alkylation repair protein [Thaumarchaeota archaeon]|nr:DNA alkylation repair protein [Nitrososphaerota archaeon]